MNFRLVDSVKKKRKRKMKKHKYKKLRKHYMNSEFLSQCRSVGRCFRILDVERIEEDIFGKSSRNKRILKMRLEGLPFLVTLVPSPESWVHESFGGRDSQAPTTLAPLAAFLDQKSNGCLGISDQQKISLPVAQGFGYNQSSNGSMNQLYPHGSSWGC
ncbi:Ribosomal protein mS38 [Theobroma cacao]|nr:Ribosomal protein mS38 [Theobroma cacao]